MLRRLAVHQRVIGNAKARGVGPHIGGVAGALLEGSDVTEGRQTRGFQADRTGPGADFPDD